MVAYRFDHLHITGEDPDEALRFYSGVLGARIIGIRESGGSKAIDLDLYGVPVRISRSTGADGALGGLRFGLHHIGLTVSNLEEGFHHLCSGGFKVVVEPAQPRPGVKTAFVMSPDDVLYELVERVD